MNIIFMGTPDFAVPSLLALIESDHKVISVITQPDRPKGRGKKIKHSPIKDVALEHNIEVLQPIKLTKKSFVNYLNSLKVDLIIVIAYGKILPKEILSIPKNGCINVHASLLPAYRGAAPIHWAIINGEKKTGITTMYMDTGLDTGDIILKKETQIPDNMTAGELHDVLADLGRKTLLETIENINEEKVTRKAQNHEEHTYAPMLDKNVGKINWCNSAEDIVNLIRGTNPWPGAYSILNNQKIKLWKASLYQAFNKKDKPGTILEHIPDLGWLVQTGKGCVAIEEIQMPNSIKMDVDSYIRGHHIKTGTILGEDGCD